MRKNAKRQQMPVSAIVDEMNPNEPVDTQAGKVPAKQWVYDEAERMNKSARQYHDGRRYRGYSRTLLCGGVVVGITCSGGSRII